MKIVGVDPGPTLAECAFVVWDVEAGTVRLSSVTDAAKADKCVVEGMSPIGAMLGQATIDTLVTTGRLLAMLESVADVVVVTRREVKKTLLGKVSGNDREIRMALEERFGAKGTKSAPGVLFGVSGHHLAALAVAYAWRARQKD